MPRVPACWGRCLTAREANVADSMHDACRPLAAHNVYSALTAVVCRPDLVSLRSAAQTARHRVTVRDRVDIRGILLVGGDIGRIIIAAEPRRGWIAVRRRIVAIVPKRIIAAVPRRVAPHHHRRAPMLEMGQGCRTDARERHDLSRRRNRNGAGATTCRGGAIAARLIGALFKGAARPPKKAAPLAGASTGATHATKRARMLAAIRMVIALVLPA
jgi:hypothetical protein